MRGHGPSGEVEVERVEQLDRGVRHVHGDLLRDVEQPLGVVEDDLHAGADEVVGHLLRAVGGHGEHADEMLLSRMISASWSYSLTGRFPTCRPTFSGSVSKIAAMLIPC